MGRFLNLLVTGTVILGLGACAHNYEVDGRGLAFTDANRNGYCDTVSWESQGDSHSRFLDSEMTQEEINNTSPRFAQARANGARFHFPDNCGVNPKFTGYSAPVDN